MFKKLLVLIYFFISLDSLVYSQVQEEWISRYNGTADSSDEAYSTAIDFSGNVYVTGYSSQTGTFHDYVTIKYNSSGVLQWIQRYNGPVNGNDEATVVKTDYSGNVYVTGKSKGENLTRDFLTIKYNSSGIQQWTQRYEGPGGYDEPTAMTVDNMGNVYVTGITGSDFVTVKYNTFGVQQWVQQYNGPGFNSHDISYSISVDSEGNAYVSGKSDAVINTFENYVTIKYNASGNVQWIQTFNGLGSYNDIAYSNTVDNLGNVYVTGTSYSGYTTTFDIATIKYNASGVQQWVQIYNLGAYDSGMSIAVDASGNVYVAGFGNAEYITIKYNNSGIQQWVQTYNGGEATSLKLDASGNIYVTGLSTGIGTFYDYATIKYNSSGSQQWVQRYNGTGNSDDRAFSLAVDNSGNVYVTGESTDSVTGRDYLTIKYSQPFGIHPISNEVPNTFSLLQNYPNPFNPTTKIKFTLPKTSFITIKIYNILGAEVTVLVNEQLQPGTYIADWDANNYPSGIYYYKIQSTDYNDTRKMILLK